MTLRQGEREKKGIRREKEHYQNIYIKEHKKHLENKEK